jgi:small conductance mechanosensitive channel
MGIAIEPGLFANLTDQPDAARRLVEMAGAAAVNLVLGLLILAVTVWLSGALSRLIKKSFSSGKRRRRVDITLANFIASLVRYLVLIVGLIAVLAQLGVQTTSVLAVLGAASLAVGLALQGALSNVAAGVMLLILRPYRVNDLVEISGRQGRVRSLDLFTTELTSPDGLRLILPNAKVFGDLIVNYNASGHRRLELKFGIDYADDAGKAIDILKRLAAGDKRVLADPPAWAGVTGLTDFAVTVTLRAWTLPGDNGEVETDMIRAVKETFDAEGLTFPYPHQVGLSRDELLGKVQAEPENPAPP